MNQLSKIQTPHPTLFKAINPSTHEERFFENTEEALKWVLSHKDWVLKKRETILWTYPLEQVMAQDCWIKVG